MPVLSKFYGIIIRMFFTNSFVPHFHALYRDQELLVSIDELRIIQGDAPSRVREMVLEWAAAHQAELQVAWNRCQEALAPLPIQPLE